MLAPHVCPTSPEGVCRCPYSLTAVELLHKRALGTLLAADHDLRPDCNVLQAPGVAVVASDDLRCIRCTAQGAHMMHDTTIPTLSDLSASRGLWLWGGVRTVLIERARLSRPTLVACTTRVGS